MNHKADVIAYIWSKLKQNGFPQVFFCSRVEHILKGTSKSFDSLSHCLVQCNSYSSLMVWKN